MRSIACEHPKSFISKSLSPNSEHVQTLTVKSNIKSNTDPTTSPESPTKEILLPPFLIFLVIFSAHSRDSPLVVFVCIFSTSQLRGTKRQISGLGHLEFKVGTKRQGVSVVFFLYGKFQLQ